MNDTKVGFFPYFCSEDVYKRQLLLLATNKGRVLTYAQIYEQVWGDFTTGNENNTIGFHICNPVSYTHLCLSSEMRIRSWW